VADVFAQFIVKDPNVFCVIDRGDDDLHTASGEGGL
jgi:hypothetical protein